MKVSQAANLWLNYHRANSGQNTIRAYKELMERFCQENGEKDLKELTSDDVLDFLNGITEGRKSQTRKTRFSHLTSFFNFTKNNIDQSFQNPCDSPIIKKMFRARALAKKADDVVGIHLKPHDLRRHAATFASRSGGPLEIVSKVILRHANLSMTQRYLGKISDVEAIRWIENIHG
jgi:integrase